MTTDLLERPSTTDNTPSDRLAHVVCEACYPPGAIPRFALCGFMLSEIPADHLPPCPECAERAARPYACPKCWPDKKDAA